MPPNDGLAGAEAQCQQESFVSTGLRNECCTGYWMAGHYQKKTFSEYREMAREHLSPPLKDVTLGAWEFNSLLNIIFHCFRRSKQLGVEIWKEEE